MTELFIFMRFWIGAYSRSVLFAFRTNSYFILNAYLQSEHKSSSWLSKPQDRVPRPIIGFRAEQWAQPLSLHVFEPPCDTMLTGRTHRRWFEPDSLYIQMIVICFICVQMAAGISSSVNVRHYKFGRFSAESLSLLLISMWEKALLPLQILWNT